MSEAQSTRRVDHRPRPTMRDVAALAGVGLKTVSRVVNGVPTVAPGLVTQVQRAADQLGYRPNLTASSLRRADGRTRTVGLLLEDVANPFSAALHRAIEDVALERGVFVLTGSLDEDADRERDLARALIDRRVDGLIIAPASRDQSYLFTEKCAGTHVVFVDREPSLLDADAVVSNNRQGAIDAVRHLIDGGHRRIAYLGDNTEIATARERFGGYIQALTDRRLPPDTSLIRHDLHTIEASTRAAHELLTATDPPTALFASQNLVTIGTTRALWTLDLQDRIALVGFDDFVLADILRPGVTLVSQHPAQIGRLAAQILFRRIDGDRSPTETHIIPTRLVIRGSGEISPR